MFPRVNGLRTIEFGTPGEMRDRLVQLVLHGNKRATAGLMREYEIEGEPVEHVGELLAMVDNSRQQVGTLLVTNVDVLRFIDVPDALALAEGEGDLDAADFRASHLRFWNTCGEHVDDDTLIATVYFDLVDEASVSLHPLTTADVDWITAACQDPEIHRWTLVPRPYFRQHAIDFVATGAGEYKTWAIRRVSDSRDVGMIGIHSFDKATATAHIGYWIAPWGRNAGAARTAVRHVCAIVASADGARFVTAHVADTNIASQRVLLSCGFDIIEKSATQTCPDGDIQRPALIFKKTLD